MEKLGQLFELIKKHGMRKLVLGSEFLGGLLIGLLCGKLDAPSFVTCFCALVGAVFVANAAEHYTKKEDKSAS